MKNNLENLMIEYLQILLPYHVDKQPIPADLEEKLHDMQAEIIKILLFNAEKPIFFSNKKFKNVFNTASSYFLDRKNRQFLFERLDNSDKSVDIVWNYLDRLLNLKPFLLFLNLPEKVNILLSDAIRSYLYSCNRAAIILCGALLEEILTTELEKINPNLVYIKKKGGRTVEQNMPVIIQNAIDNGILDNIFKNDAEDIKTERNDAVHNCKIYNNADTLEIIEKTKIIMQNIYERQ